MRQPIDSNSSRSSVVWSIGYLTTFLSIAALAISCGDSSAGGGGACVNVTCQDNATCQLETGECACDEGFALEGAACIADGSDECADVACQDHATCTQDGECECDDGFRASGDTCVADNAELCEGVTCQDHATCDASDGQCRCDEGTHPDGDTCVANAVDRCEDVVCQDHATCDPGGGQCTCDDGYHADADACVANPPGPCDEVVCQDHATCNPDDGQCSCDGGYHPDADACVADSANPCDGVTCQDHATCNTDDGQCVCNDGTHPDGDACVADTCEDAITAAEHNTTFGDAYVLAVPSTVADLSLRAAGTQGCEYTEDWYEISYVYGYTFTVALSGQGGSAELTLFDTSLNQLGQSSSSGSTEQLEFTFDDNQIVYVRVSSPVEAQVRYELTATKACGDGFVDNLLWGQCIPDICVVRSQVYLYCDENTDWYDSRDTCASLGAHLVTVNDAAETATLATYPGEFHSYWNGYNKLGGSGWEWLDGSSTYENWWSGQPQDGDLGLEYSCANMDGLTFEWGAADCYTQKWFICEQNQ